MALLEIKISEGGKRKITIKSNVPNKIVDDWESDKQDDAILEINYRITNHLENMHHKLNQKSSKATLVPRK